MQKEFQKDTMLKNPPLVNAENGCPIDNMRDSWTAGSRGPTLIQDTALFENLQIQNRERIPERTVHARGMTAKGEFRCTDSASDLTIAEFLQRPGETCPIAVRFSTVINRADSPEWLRDPRGFAVKMYTKQGNYDIVANNWPVFFIRDAIRFPEAVRAMKPSPKTGRQEFWRFWDYFANFPESLHAFSYYFDDIGTPLGYRHYHGFSIDTFKFINKEGKETLFRWHFQNVMGEKGQLDQDACKQAFSAHTTELLESIEAGDYPKYNVMVQVLDPENLPPLSFDPLDITREWPTALFPFRKVGEFVLNENIQGIFAENEQIAFSPSRMVPGIGPSDDKSLQGRLIAYTDTQRYRLGVNNQQLPINAPKCPHMDIHADGLMHFKLDTKGDQDINYFPSFTQKALKEHPKMPQETEMVHGHKIREGIPMEGLMDDFHQPGIRWRSFDPERQQRFADRVAISLSGPRLGQELRQVWLGYWNKVDPRLHAMIMDSLTMLADSSSVKDQARYDQLMRLKEGFSLTSPRP